MTETNSKENTKNKKLKNEKYMKKIICVVIILIGVSGFCFAQEVETEKVVKEKTYNKVVIGLNGGGSFGRNDDQHFTSMLNVDVLFGKESVIRFGCEINDCNWFLGAGIVMRENIVKNTFIGATVMAGWTMYATTHYSFGPGGPYGTSLISSNTSSNSVLGFRCGAFCEYKFSDVGIGAEVAYSYVPSNSLKHLSVMGGLRFYIK